MGGDGRTRAVARVAPGAPPLLQLETRTPGGFVLVVVFGSYLHGFFDRAEVRSALVEMLCRKKGITLDLKAGAFDYQAYKEQQYDALAAAVRESLDMKLIYQILEAGL